MQLTPHIARALVALVAALAVPPGAATSIWMANESLLARFDVEAGEFVRRVPVNGVIRLAGTAAGGVWALAGDRALRLSAADEASVATADVASLGYGAARLMAVDPDDAAVWIVTTDNLLAHFDAHGDLVGGYTLPERASAVAVALDGTLWVAGERAAWHFAPTLDLLAIVPLDDGWNDSVTSILVDSIAGQLWVIGMGSVAVRPTAGPGTWSYVVPAGGDIRGAALDSGTGNIWLLAGSRLDGYDSGGHLVAAASLERAGAADARLLASAAVDGALVVASTTQLSVFDRDGTLRTSTALPQRFDLYAVAPWTLAPAIALLRPPDGAYAADARPTFELEVGVRCNGAPCAQPPGYLSTLRFEASLDGAAVDRELVFDPLTGRYAFSPATALLPGAHLLVAQAFDRLGHRSNAIESRVNVLAADESAIALKANKVPTVALTAPKNNATFVAGSDVLLSASASDADGTIAKVDFFRDGSTLIGTATTPPYSIIWEHVAVGSYKLTAKATDDRNGVKTSSAVAIKVTAPRNAAPAVALTSPAAGSVVSGRDLAIAAIASDPDGRIAKVEAYDGSTLLGTIAGGNATVEAVWSIAEPTPGDHVINVIATDDAGARTTAAAAVTVNALPFAVLTSPVQCSVLAPQSGLTLTADALDRDGSIARVDFYADSTLLGSARNPPYSITWPDVPVGTHSLTVLATDDRGDTRASNAVTVSVAVRNDPPTVVMTAPANGAVHVAPASLTLSADAADPDGTIAKVEFYAGSALVGTATAAPYTAIWSDVAAGTYLVTAKATDNLGATATSAPITVFVDQPPIVTMIGPEDGSVYPIFANVAITGRAYDAHSVLAKMELIKDGVSLGACAPPPSSSLYTCTWNWAAVPAGRFTFAWRATDVRGATATSTPLHVTVNAIPVVAIVSPAFGESIAATEAIAITAMVTEVVGTIAKVDFYADGVAIGTATSAPYTVNWVGAPAGSHTLTAVATDATGTTGTSRPVAITVDPFALNIVSPRPGEAIYAASTVVSGTFGGATPDRVTVNGVPAALGPGSFAAAIPVALGDNTVAVEATVGGAAVARSVWFNGAVSKIVAATLASEPTFHDDNVLVTGYVDAPANSAVYVEGRMAVVDPDGKFFLNNLPLASGANSVTITVNPPDGPSFQQAYTVYSDAVAPFAVAAAPVASVGAPLTTTLTLTNREAIPYAQLEIDTDGDGIYEYGEAGPERPVATRSIVLTYPNIGTYELRLRLKDGNGQTIYFARVRLRVGDPADLAARLRGVYDGMLNRLRAGSIDAAVGAITGTVRERYRDAFSRLGAALPRVIDALGEPGEVTLADEYAKMVVTREKPDGTYRYEIQFIRDGDGVWRIEGM